VLKLKKKIIPAPKGQVVSLLSEIN